MFFNALKTEATKRLYVIGLRRFMGFQKAQYVSDLLGRTSVVADAPLIQSKIIQWIVHLKNVENVPSSPLQSYRNTRNTEDELLQEYLKVVDDLTIDKSKRLERENEMLRVRKSEYEALKQQVEENKQQVEEDKHVLVTGLHEQLEEFQREIEDLRNHIKEKQRQKRQ
jgi:hypothetical protein